MPDQHLQTAGRAMGISAKPTMETNLNGMVLDTGQLTVNWPRTLRQVANAVAAAAMEQALEFGHTNIATIEVWGVDGKLLVTVSANIQASWPR